MQVEQVILIGHEAFDVNTRFGLKTKSVFTDSTGRELQVWKAAMSAQLLPLVGTSTPATVSIEAKQNGEYLNFEIKDVIGAAPAPTVAAVPVPTAVQPGQQVVVQNVTPGVDTPAQRAISIKRQSALERAILIFGTAGENALVEFDALLELADQLIDYFENGRQAVSVADEGPSV